jgi:hypothetical protein
MEGLGAAASVIAVVELAAKVGKICLDYWSAVKSARSDIERLQKYTENLKTIAHDVQKLLQGPHGARLETSQKLLEALNNTRSQLGDVAAKLEATLHMGRRAKAMRRLGLRALEWPFESKDVDKIIANLQRDQDSITNALQIDQTYAQTLYPIGYVANYNAQHRNPRNTLQDRPRNASGRKRRGL